MSTKTFKNKFYIVGFIALIMMSLIVIYTFRTLFESLTVAYEVETEIPESELRINKGNLDKAYNAVFETEPTELEVELFTYRGISASEEEDSETQENVELSEEEN